MDIFIEQIYQQIVRFIGKFKQIFIIFFSMEVVLAIFIFCLFNIIKQVNQL